MNSAVTTVTVVTTDTNLPYRGMTRNRVGDGCDGCDSEIQIHALEALVSEEPTTRDPRMSAGFDEITEH